VDTVLCLRFALVLPSSDRLLFLLFLVQIEMLWRYKCVLQVNRVTEMVIFLEECSYLEYH